MPQAIFVNIIKKGGASLVNKLLPTKGAGSVYVVLSHLQLVSFTLHVKPSFLRFMAANLSFTQFVT